MAPMTSPPQAWELQVLARATFTWLKNFQAAADGCGTGSAQHHPSIKVCSTQCVAHAAKEEALIYLLCCSPQTCRAASAALQAAWSQLPVCPREQGSANSHRPLRALCLRGCMQTASLDSWHTPLLQDMRRRRAAWKLVLWLLAPQLTLRPLL